MTKKQSTTEIIQLMTKQEAEKVKLAITDIDGVLRGKLISLEKFRSVAEKGFGFCDVVFGWDAGDQAYDNGKYTGWHTGYPDAQAVIDIGTFRRVPWEGDLPFFLADFRDAGAVTVVDASAGQGNAPTTKGDAIPVCPRGLLKKVI